MLEAEGTKEGRMSLLEAVKGKSVVESGSGSWDGRDAGTRMVTPRGLWEVVRDKCGAGRLWLRCVV